MSAALLKAFAEFSRSPGEREFAAMTRKRSLACLSLPSCWRTNASSSEEVGAGTAAVRNGINKTSHEFLRARGELTLGRMQRLCEGTKQKPRLKSECVRGGSDTMFCPVVRLDCVRHCADSFLGSIIDPGLRGHFTRHAFGPQLFGSPCNAFWHIPRTGDSENSPSAIINLSNIFHVGPTLPYSLKMVVVAWTHRASPKDRRPGFSGRSQNTFWTSSGHRGMQCPDVPAPSRRLRTTQDSRRTRMRSPAFR